MEWIGHPLPFFSANAWDWNRDVLNSVRLSTIKVTFVCMGKLKDSFLSSSTTIIRTPQIIVWLQRLRLGHRAPALLEASLGNTVIHSSAALLLFLTSQLFAASHLICRPTWSGAFYGMGKGERGRRHTWPYFFLLMTKNYLHPLILPVHSFICWTIVTSCMPTAKWGYEDISTSPELNIWFTQEVLTLWWKTRMDKEEYCSIFLY